MAQFEGEALHRSKALMVESRNAQLACKTAQLPAHHGAQPEQSTSIAGYANDCAIRENARCTSGCADGCTISSYNAREPLGLKEREHQTARICYALQSRLRCGHFSTSSRHRVHFHTRCRAGLPRKPCCTAGRPTRTAATQQTLQCKLR